MTNVKTKTTTNEKFDTRGKFITCHFVGAIAWTVASEESRMSAQARSNFQTDSVNKKVLVWAMCCVVSKHVRASEYLSAEHIEAKTCTRHGHNQTSNVPDVPDCLGVGDNVNGSTEYCNLKSKSEVIR